MAKPDAMLGDHPKEKPMRTTIETALALAVILNRSEQSRARVSSKTIKILAKRQNLRSAFVVELTGALAEYGWILFEIASGGFGAIQAKTAEAAKPVTAKRLLSDDERRALRRDAADWDAFEREVKPPEDDDASDEG
jgi:hypothetical protein